MKIRLLLTAVVGAVAVGAALTNGAAAAAPVRPAVQQGFDTVVCNTATAYIYQYESTSSTRLDALPRGAHFQVYNPNGTWDFGVRNYNSVSGNVLASQLCRTGSSVTLAQEASRAGSARNAAAGSSAVHPDVVGTRLCVTTPTLYIRNYPAGLAFNQLYQGQSFSVYEFRASGWARGYAWGHVDSDSSGYPAPYENIWTESQYLGACPAAVRDAV